jgi:ABC-type transport system substrate-binding protein
MTDIPNPTAADPVVEAAADATAGAQPANEAVARLQKERDDVYDRFLRLTAEFDKTKQGADYADACQIMHDELPWLFMWQTVRYHIVSNKLHNVILIPAAGGGSYYDAVETWTKDQ